MEEDFVSKEEYDVFHLVVRNSKGFFKSMADKEEDLDLDAGTLIPSGEIHKEKVRWKTQPSLTAAHRHCACVAQGVKSSDEMLDTPLCDPSRSQPT